MTIQTNDLLDHRSGIECVELHGPRCEAAQLQEDAVNTLYDTLHFIDDDVSSFIFHHVPSSEPPIPQVTPAAASRAFNTWRPKFRHDKRSYPDLIYGLNTLVSKFPSKKRPSFYTTAFQPLKFPFKPLTWPPQDRGEMGDIAVSFPGQVLTHRSATLNNIALFIDARSTEEQDPFQPGSREMHYRDLAHLALNARNLIIAHGLLAAYVVGIYGDSVRLARFDNAGTLVSRRFSLRTQHELLRKFLWAFANPLDPRAPFVGWDPTVRKLSVADQRWVAERLRAAGQPVPENLAQCRRVEVSDKESGEAIGFFLVTPIYLASSLVSRSTAVWKALKDTRGSRLPEDLAFNFLVVKEAWRMILFPQSELDVYERLEQIPEAERRGLPRYLGGNDFGKQETSDWSAATEKTPAHISVVLQSQVEMSGHPLPLQQTFTARYAGNTELSNDDRSHVRVVTDRVGRPLGEFRTTRQFVTAFRDALTGHKIMCKYAGVLHGDISYTNVLMVDEPSDDGCTGFVHDFDYSTIDNRVKRGLNPRFPAEGRTHAVGTALFMARKLLLHQYQTSRIECDLEALYWVFIYTVLKYTVHDVAECHHVIFKHKSTRENVQKKDAWLSSTREVEVTGNGPLTLLLARLRALFARERPMATHEEFIALCDEALAMDGWPEDDESIFFQIGSANSDPQPADAPQPPAALAPGASPKRKVEEEDVLRILDGAMNIAKRARTTAGSTRATMGGSENVAPSTRAAWSSSEKAPSPKKKAPKKRRGNGRRRA